MVRKGVLVFLLCVHTAIAQDTQSEEVGFLKDRQEVLAWCRSVSDDVSEWPLEQQVGYLELIRQVHWFGPTHFFRIKSSPHPKGKMTKKSDELFESELTKVLKRAVKVPDAGNLVNRLCVLKLLSRQPGDEGFLDEALSLSEKDAKNGIVQMMVVEALVCRGRMDEAWPVLKKAMDAPKYTFYQDDYLKRMALVARRGGFLRQKVWPFVNAMGGIRDEVHAVERQALFLLTMTMMRPFGAGKYFTWFEYRNLWSTYLVRVRYGLKGYGYDALLFAHNRLNSFTNRDLLAKAQVDPPEARKAFVRYFRLEQNLLQRESAWLHHLVTAWRKQNDNADDQTIATMIENRDEWFAKKFTNDKGERVVRPTVEEWTSARRRAKRPDPGNAGPDVTPLDIEEFGF